MSMGLPNSPLNQFIGLLDKKRVRIFAFAITLVSFIDLFGVFVLGILGGYLSGLIKVEEIPAISLLMRDQKTTYNIVILLTLSIFFFVLKNLSVLLVNKKFLSFLLNEQLRITSEVNHLIFSSRYSTIRKANPHNLSYSLNDGISIITTGVVGNLVQLVVDSILLFAFLIVLFISDWISALACMIYFGASFYLLNLIVLRRVSRYAHESIESTIQARSSLLQNILLFRIIRTSGKQAFFQDIFMKNKRIGLQAEARYAWIQQAPKALIEVVMLLGILLITLISINSGTDSQTFSKLAIYLGVGLRVVPLMLRLQSSLFSLRSAIPAGAKTLSAISDLSKAIDNYLELGTKGSEFSNTLSMEQFKYLNLSNVVFSFPDEPEIEILSDINLGIEKGERLVITGPSGGGKSTLCDLILGLIQPSAGDVSINGHSTSSWMASHPGSISYLPQETYLFEGSLRSNICVGLNADEVSDERLNKVIRISQLEQLIERLPLGLETLINPLATNISGGEKQRLGIARALYPDPSVVIMDEATSHLDSDTEDLFLEAISKLGDSVTIIYIAHRLHALKFFARVVLLDGGAIAYDGNLKDARNTSPKLTRILEKSGFKVESK